AQENLLDLGTGAAGRRNVDGPILVDAGYEQTLSPIDDMLAQLGGEGHFAGIAARKNVGVRKVDTREFRQPVEVRIVQPGARPIAVGGAPVRHAALLQLVVVPALDPNETPDTVEHSDVALFELHLTDDFGDGGKGMPL